MLLGVEKTLPEFTAAAEAAGKMGASFAGLKAQRFHLEAVVSGQLSVVRKQQIPRFARDDNS